MQRHGSSPFALPPLPRPGSCVGPLLLLGLAVGALAAPSAAGAQDTRGYASMAVQNRIHGGPNEITIYGGILPLDAFEKGVSLGASYTLHFDELIAWEVIHFVHSFQFSTELNDQLQDLELSATPFEVVNDYALTNLVIKPIYWKGAALNEGLVYGEFLFLLGGGYSWFTRSNRFVLDLGFATRIWATEWLSFRLDARYLMFFRDQVFDFDIQDEVNIALGVSAQF